MMGMIIELLRSEIETCEVSRYAISKESGVSEAQLCRLMQGRSLSCENADKLFDYFGFEIRKKRKTR